jgi:hypothetical protein
MIKALTYSQSPHPFPFPPLRGGKTGNGSEWPGLIWLGNGWGTGGNGSNSLTNNGNGSGTGHPLNVHVRQGTGRERVKFPRPQLRPGKAAANDY